MEENFYCGNLETDFKKSWQENGRGWLLGAFNRFNKKDPRRTDRIELLYWTTKKAKEERAEHAPKIQATSYELTIVLKGHIQGFVVVEGEIKKVTLSTGEYILIKPKVINNLVQKTSRDAKLITIKTPSDPTDGVKLTPKLLENLIKKK